MMIDPTSVVALAVSVAVAVAVGIICLSVCCLIEQTLFASCMHGFIIVPPVTILPRVLRVEYWEVI